MQESLEKQIQKIKKCNSHCLKPFHANPAYSITKHNIAIQDSSVSKCSYTPNLNTPSTGRG